MSLGVLLGSGRLGATSSPGLICELEDGEWQAAMRVSSPSFFLHAGESLHPQIASEFRATWRGVLRVTLAGDYRFPESGARIQIDGRAIGTGALELSGGDHRFRVEFERRPGPAQLSLRWSSEHFTEEPIPDGVFFAEDDEASSTAASHQHGRELVEELSCTACHETASKTLVRPAAPRLRGVAQRVRPGWLQSWLQDSQASHSHAGVPAGFLLPGQAPALVAFLKTLRDATPSEATSLYTPHDVAKGAELWSSIGCAACHGPSRSPVAGEEAVPAPSVESPIEFRARVHSKWRAPALKTFLLDPARVWPSGRMPSLGLNAEEAHSLTAFLLRDQPPLPEFADAAPPFRPDTLSIGLGLFTSLDCIACHRLDHHAFLYETGARVPFRRKTRDRPALERVDVTRGCLSEDPAGPPPRYDLSPEDRRSLRTYLRSITRHPEVSPAPLFGIRSRLERLQCARCHPSSSSTPIENIDERVPALTGIGHKLRRGWLDGVLLGSLRVREDTVLRMPQFGRAAVAPLVDLLIRADGVDPSDSRAQVRSDDPMALRGVELLGSDTGRGGLNCIACHDFRDVRPVADEKGPQLANVAERLRADWFRRWMLQPGRLVSGTSMPSYFPVPPRADDLQRVEQLWTAFSLGEALPEPPGLGEVRQFLANETMPVPTQGPVLRRFPMPDATAAAISVGCPKSGKLPALSYTFDAATCQLVYAWRGGFLDLSRSLVKKMPLPEIIGERFYRRRTFPLRIGTLDGEPSVRFRGYRLVGGYPEFRYDVDGVRVRELIRPSRKGDALLDGFVIERLDGPAWWVHEPTSGGPELTTTIGPLVDGRLSLPRGTPLRFEVRIPAAEAAE